MMRAVLFFAVVNLALYPVAFTKCIKCGKTAAKELQNPLFVSGNSLLSHSFFETKTLDKHYTGILRLHKVDGGRNHHFGQDLRVRRLGDGTFEKWARFDRIRGNLTDCQNNTGTMVYRKDKSKNKAVFSFWKTPRTPSSVNISEVWFSSCPDQYIWTLMCFDKGVLGKRCSLENSGVTLMVPRVDLMTEADELPWWNIAKDLQHDTGLTLGGHSNFQTHNIFERNYKF